MGSKSRIAKDFVSKWRRDIVKINPVIKVNCKGENIIGHSAPILKIYLKWRLDILVV